MKKMMKILSLLLCFAILMSCGQMATAQGTDTEGDGNIPPLPTGEETTDTEGDGNAPPQPTGDETGSTDGEGTSDPGQTPEIPQDPSQPVASGTYGNLLWALSADGCLTISGSDYMTDPGVISVPDWGTWVEQITSVVIEDGVLSICPRAFYNFTSIKTITIPASVETIGSYAFTGCTALTDVTFTGTRAQWDAIQVNNDQNYFLSEANVHCPAYAAGSWYGFDWIIDNDGVLTITGSGENGLMHMVTITDAWRPYSDQILSAVIKDGAGNLGAYAFYECANLKSVTLPANLTSIGRGAFINCGSLTSITLPDSLTEICENVFYDCSGLTDVYYGGTAQQWNSITIGANNEALNNATLHVEDNTAIQQDQNGNYLFSSFEELEAICGLNLGGGDYFAQYIGGGDLVMKNNITLPSFLTVETPGNIIIPAGVDVLCHSSLRCDRLTVKGGMEVYSNNMGRGNFVSALDVSGDLYLDSMCIWVDKGDGITEGEVSGFENIRFSQNSLSFIGHRAKPTTENDLRDVVARANNLQSGNVQYSVWTFGDITLQQNLTIPKNGINAFHINGKLTIPEGQVLETGCFCQIDGEGLLTVNGTLLANAGLAVQAATAQNTAHLTVGANGRINGNGIFQLCSAVGDPADLLTGIDTSDPNVWSSRTYGEWNYLQCSIADLPHGNSAPTISAQGSSVFAPGSGQDLSFACTEAVWDVYVGNIQLTDPMHYSVSSDGTTVTLRAGYLNHLNPGNTYALKVFTANGYWAQTPFQIAFCQELIPGTPVAADREEVLHFTAPQDGYFNFGYENGNATYELQILDWQTGMWRNEPSTQGRKFVKDEAIYLRPQYDQIKEGKLNVLARQVTPPAQDSIEVGAAYNITNSSMTLDFILNVTDKTADNGYAYGLLVSWTSDDFGPGANTSRYAYKRAYAARNHETVTLTIGEYVPEQSFYYKAILIDMQNGGILAEGSTTHFVQFESDFNGFNQLTLNTPYDMTNLGQARFYFEAAVDGIYAVEAEGVNSISIKDNEGYPVAGANGQSGYLFGTPVKAGERIYITTAQNTDQSGSVAVYTGQQKLPEATIGTQTMLSRVPLYFKAPDDGEYSFTTNSSVYMHLMDETGSTVYQRGIYYRTALAKGQVLWISGIDRVPGVTLTIVQESIPLRKMVFPAGLTHLQEEACSGLLIDEAVFGEDIQYIGSKAFADCPNLRRVEIPVADVDIEDDAFKNSNNVILYAPIGGSVEQYAVEHSIFLEAMIP